MQLAESAAVLQCCRPLTIALGKSQNGVELQGQNIEQGQLRVLDQWMPPSLRFAKSQTGCGSPESGRGEPLIYFPGVSAVEHQIPLNVR